MQRILGIAAILSLAAALNIAVATQALFVPMVLMPLGASILIGLLWLALVVKQAASTSLRQGKVLGSLNAGLASTFFLGICMILYVMVQSLDISLDLTQEGRRDLSPQTIQVLEALNTEVTVTCFFLDVDDEFILIGHEKSKRFLEQCQEYTDLLKVEILNPQLDVGIGQMQSMGISHASPQGTIIIHAGARKRVITLGGGSPRLEERDFTNALINVVRASQPKVAYLQGHGEEDITDNKTPGGAGGIATVLQTESYVVEPYTMDLNSPEIPRDYDILIINNYIELMSTREIEALDTWMEQGGRLLVMMEPRLPLQSGLTNMENFRPWLLRNFGIDVASNLITRDADPGREYSLNMNYDNTPFTATDEQPGQYRGAFEAQHPITRGFNQTLLFNGVCTVTPAEEMPKGVVATILLRSLPEFWAETDLLALQQGEKATRSSEETEGPLPVAVAAAKQTATTIEGSGQFKQARVVVIGNGRFATNDQLTAVPGHLNFFLNACAWLAETEELIAIRPTGKEDPPLILSSAHQRIISWVAILFTVQSVVIAGFIMFMLRRKHQ